MKKHLPLKIFLIFVLTFITGTWIMQNNIENYWQQTYHRASPFLRLQQYSWWREGAQLRQLIIGWLNPNYDAGAPLDTILAANDENDDDNNDENGDDNNLPNGSGRAENYAENSNFSPESQQTKPETESDSTPDLGSGRAVLLAKNDSDHSENLLPDHPENLLLEMTFPEDELNAPPNDLNIIPLNAISATPKLPNVLDFLVSGQQTLAADTLAALPTKPNKPTIRAGKRVFLAGDSMMQGFAPYIQRDLLKHKVKAINMGKPSTGLRYPAYYNWPKTVESVLSEHDDIEIMMIFLGPNDPWDVQDPHNKRRNLRFKTPEWEAFYRGEIRKILDSAAAHEVQVIWIGPPIMRKESYSKRVMYLDSLIADEVEKAGQFYVDTKAPFTDAKGNYSKYITHNGKKVSVRQNDGVHINIAGCKILSEIVMEQIEFVE